MRKLIYVLLIAILLPSCTSYVRLGEATIISTRNFDTSKQYQFLKRSVKVKVSKKTAKRQNIDMLTLAIEKAVELDYNGEYLQNAKIYINKSGERLILEADIWGRK